MPIAMIYTFNEYYISLNNIYNSFLMASLMCILMYFYMPFSKIYLLLFTTISIVSYLAIRNQWFVNDTFFLRDMIPHHSMALQTSYHILEKTKDPRIKELATNIYNSQVKEIEIMKNFII